MPTYEYLCRVCSHHFEKEQSIKEKPHAECPKCLVTCDNRLISGGSFILKGDGWAKDNYAKKT